MEMIKVKDKTTKRIKRIATMWYKKNELTHKIEKEVRKLTAIEREFYKEKLSKYTK